MNNLSIKRLAIDNRNLEFSSGANVIIGPNASGKTTIYKYLKHALGLSIDLTFGFFRYLELVIIVDATEFTFRRRNGDPTIYIEDESNIKRSFRARSNALNEFFQLILEPKFAIGNKLTSIFPVLEFCFVSEDDRLNSKSLLSAFRLICGANDKLISTASRDIEALTSQILVDEDFLKRNDDFLENFYKNLGGHSLEVRQDISVAVKSARDDIIKPLEYKKNILEFSIGKVKQLTSNNETHFAIASNQIEYVLTQIIDKFPDELPGKINLHRILSRETQAISYGQTILADYLMRISILRATNLVDLNMPKIFINDGMGSRSFDSYYSSKISSLLEGQIRDDINFQYIEFTHESLISTANVVANLNEKRGGV